jgi:hypothetical protein
VEAAAAAEEEKKKQQQQQLASTVQVLPGSSTCTVVSYEWFFSTSVLLPGTCTTSSTWGAGCYSPSLLNRKWGFSWAAVFRFIFVADWNADRVTCTYSHPYRLQFSFMKFWIRIYRLWQPLNFFHKILRVFSSVCHFRSVAHHTPPNLFSRNVADFQYWGAIFFSSSSRTP